MYKWDQITEVVIIGSGIAGMSAAIEAAGLGAKVIVIEKSHVIGGNSIISDGGVAAPDTQLQKVYGIIDSNEMMYVDMIKAGRGHNNPELVKILVENAKEAFEWSKDYLGVEYLNRVDIFGGHSVPRCYTAKNISGSTIIKRQRLKFEELGGTFLLKTQFIEYIQDEVMQVIGVKVRTHNDDGIYDEQVQILNIKAEKGVILATGGFGSDVEFRSKQDPRLGIEIDSTNRPTATAEALVETLRIHASALDLDQIQLGPWASPDEKGYGVGPMFSEYIVFQYGIIVDIKKGERFINELGDRKMLADKQLEIGSPCIGIADTYAIELSGWNIEPCLRKGVVKVFDTLKELADYYIIESEALHKTIQRFNGFVTNHEDTDYSKPMLIDVRPIEKAPFYGIRLWPKVHYTMGGICINEACEVINHKGESIKRLFAAGEVTGGIHGASRLGSCSLTECMVFGRIAGRNCVLSHALVE